MRLLEIVRGKVTSREVIATCMQLSKKLGKIGVLVGNCRGFVGNRMFQPYMRESVFLVEEGAAVTEVDNALAEFGMAMGPMAVGDLALMWDGESARSTGISKNRAYASLSRATGSANWDATGKRPAPAGTGMMKAGDRLPIRKWPR
jgi:3-hydroxyacyl-CoA dehydrogenase